MIKNLLVNSQKSSKMYKVVFSFLIIFICVYQVNAQNIGAVWTTNSAGTLDGTAFTFTGASSSTLNFDLSTSPYSGAPLSASQQITQVSASTQWSVTFSSPVTNPRVYFVFYQKGTMTFNETPTFLSGTNLSTSGNNVIMSGPVGSNHHGVVEFTGTHTTITVTGTTVTSGGSGLTFGLIEPTLPVELSSFQAELKEDVIQLNWQTASELYHRGFEVERSFNGDNFQKIGFVEGKGTAAITSSYQFIDKTPVNGLNYYRLKHTDLNGKIEYSDILSIEYKVEKSIPIQLYPNPVQNQLTISNAVGTLTIYNHLGQKVKEIINTDEHLNINTSNFLQGHYILHIRNPNSKIIVKPFVTYR